MYNVSFQACFGMFLALQVEFTQFNHATKKLPFSSECSGLFAAYMSVFLDR